MQIMNKYHPRWKEFLGKLKYILDRVHCNSTHEYTEFVLKTIPEIDIKDTLNYFNNQENFCDCLVHLKKDK